MGHSLIFWIRDEHFRYWLSEEILHIPPVHFIKTVTPLQGWGGEYQSQKEWQLGISIKLPDNHIGKLITGRQINIFAR